MGCTDSLWEEINERNKAYYASVKLTWRQLTKVSTLWLYKWWKYRLSWFVTESENTYRARQVYKKKKKKVILTAVNSQWWMWWITCDAHCLSQSVDLPWGREYFYVASLYSVGFISPKWRLQNLRPKEEFSLATFLTSQAAKFIRYFPP